MPTTLSLIRAIFTPTLDILGRLQHLAWRSQPPEAFTALPDLEPQWDERLRVVEVISPCQGVGRAGYTSQVVRLHLRLVPPSRSPKARP